jgi:hypothetical protein
MKTRIDMPLETFTENFEAGRARGDNFRAPRVPLGMARPIAFEIPDRLTEVTGWHGHIPFAFWLIEAARPRVLVELGTHKGDSYCAFVQAVHRLRLDSLCSAIDTWSGDEQAGFYGEEVFEELRRYHDPRFGHFSSLVRSTFDEAVANYSDASIDFLHIDGRHTYEAVKHDFETWRPKLSDRAVVLLHDIDVQDSVFGVWRLWDKLSHQFPSFAFHHCYGLGLLAVGGEVPVPIRKLTCYSEPEAQRVRTFFSALGATFSLRSENIAALSTLAYHDTEPLSARDRIKRRRLRCEQFEREIVWLRAENQSAIETSESVKVRKATLDDELAKVRSRNHRLLGDRESLLTQNFSLTEQIRKSASTRERLYKETHKLWNSVSWRLFRPLRNLARVIRGYDKETEPVSVSAPAAFAYIIAIRQSLSWELTAPLRLIGRNFGQTRESAAVMASSIETGQQPLSPSSALNTQQIREFEIISDDADFDPDFFLSPLAPRLSRAAAIEAFLLQPFGDYRNRKPCSGFNPEIYAADALTPSDDAVRNPFAHFIENGKPQGRWITPLIKPALKTPGPTHLRTALHVHAFYPDLIDEFLDALASNTSRCDLFISAGGSEELEQMQRRLQAYQNGKVQLSVVPNRGRDLGPFLTEPAFLNAKYDLIGHLHFKKSRYAVPQFGALWRRFLWRHLLGPDHSMLDLIARSFEDDPTLGLVFPADPNLVGWSKNRALACELAQRMQMNIELPEAFEFPTGTMFWCRPAAVRPLFELGLSWKDYPAEPVPMDGTNLHAIERMLGFVVEHEGFRFAATHVPGSTNVAVTQPETIPGTSPVHEAQEASAEVQPPPQASRQAMLQVEISNLWNSRSWRLLRPLRNLSRRRQGLPKETEPIALSEAHTIQTILAIRQSMSWELTAPLRLVHRAIRRPTLPVLTASLATENSAQPADQPIEPMPEAFGRLTYLRDVVSPLKLDVSIRTERRVNLLVSTIDFKYLYGGYLAVFRLALELAKQGYRTRIVIVDQCDYRPDLWRRQIQGYPPLVDLFDRVEVEYRYDRSRALAVNPEDSFLATSWWTAHVAHHAANELKQRRFVYLTQEYEPAFYEAGSMHALAEESYTFPHYALFSTELLRDYSRQHKIGVFSAADGSGDEYSVSFQNAIEGTSVPLEVLQQRTSRRFLFYARPERHAARNLFEMGIIALSEVIRDGYFDLSKWHFDGIGALQAHRLALGKDAELEMLRRVSLEEYLRVLPSYDLGLSLMLTPHPSLVPLDMAAAGLVTVTNTYANKTGEVLEAISENIIAVPPTVNGITEGLVRGLEQVDNFDRRVLGSRINWQTRWSDAFGPAVMEKLKWFIEHSNGV